MRNGAYETEDQAASSAGEAEVPVTDWCAQPGIQPSGPRDQWPCERGGLPAHRARVRALALPDAAHVPVHPAIERDQK